MDHPLHTDTIYGIVHFVLGVRGQNFLIMMNIVFILENSADPGERLPYAAFHLSLHCLPKYLFTSMLSP